MRVVYLAFASFPLRARIHTLLRFLSAPLLRVADQVPPGATLLDIGAGHGVFSALLRGRASCIVAVEPDLRKVLPVEGVQFVIGYDEAIRGSFDAVSIIDVIYKIPIADWDAFLDRIADRLKPGGTLLIKEMDPTDRLKSSWNRAQEAVSTRIGLTLGGAFSYESPADFTARLERRGFTSVQALPVDRFYPHAHLLYVATKEG